MTDLHTCGLAGLRVPVSGRSLVLTVDVEGFRADNAGAWATAVDHWAETARRRSIPIDYFVAVEDGVRLAHASEAEARTLERAFAGLVKAGGTVYPHNHGLFDPETGQARPTPAAGRPRPAGYTKRESLYSNVTYRHGESLGTWLPTVVATFRRLLDAWQCPSPRELAFRAGGWDYGSSCAEIAGYLDAVRGSDIQIDSSASSGTFGTRSWRIGSPFGSNVFRTRNDLLEVSPTWDIDCARLPTARQLLKGATRNPLVLAPWQAGLFVLVVHLDHLLLDPASPASPAPWAMIQGRIDRFFEWLAAFSDRLRLRPASIGSAAVPLLAAS